MYRIRVCALCEHYVHHFVVLLARVSSDTFQKGVKKVYNNLCIYEKKGLSSCVFRRLDFVGRYKTRVRRRNAHTKRNIIHLHWDSIIRRRQGSHHTQLRHCTSLLMGYHYYRHRLCCG